MKRAIYFLAAVILAVICLSGCGDDQSSVEKDLQRLSQIEVYSNDGELINTVLDEDMLSQFNHLNDNDISSDVDSEQDELKKEIENLNVLYTIISYKTPAAVYSDGALEKLMEMTVYEESDIIKEQIAPENIKGAHVPEEYLTFYIVVSDEDKNFLLSLAGF